VWRHQQHPKSELQAPEVGNLWDKLGELTMPVTLIRGMAAGSVVDNDDEIELKRRVPHVRLFMSKKPDTQSRGTSP